MNKETVEKLVESKERSRWGVALHIATMRGVEWKVIKENLAVLHPIVLHPIEGGMVSRRFTKDDIVIRVNYDLYGCKRNDFMANFRPVTDWETLKIATDIEKEITGIKKEVDRLIENIEKITERVKS